MEPLFARLQAHTDASGVPLSYALGDDHDEAHAIAQGRAVVYGSHAEQLRVTGRDALDLLHRLAASDVRAVERQRWCPLLLTSDKGKVIDNAQLVQAEDHLAILCGKGRLAEVKAWIERFVITEDVELQGEPHAQHWWLVGEDAASAAARTLGVAPLDGPYSCRQSASGDLLLSAGPHWTDLARMSLASSRADSIVTGLQELGIEPVGRIEFDRWRIARGRVLEGSDLEAGLNPLEAGLRNYVSFSKGCYVGQEVVARLDTYDKVRRTVAVLDLPHPADAGDTVSRDGKSVGHILAYQAAVALALLSKDVPAGSEVEVGGAAANVRSVTPA